MNPFVYFLNLYRIGLMVQERQMRACVEAMTPGTMCINNNPPLFEVGAICDGDKHFQMVDDHERCMAKALRTDL